MKLNVELVEEGIQQFYDRVAEAIGLDSSTAKYDCSKILVSERRFYIISNYYSSLDTFGMAWVCYGPKISAELTGEEVEIEEGFICG